MRVFTRKFAALFSAVALSAAVLSGCGGESSAEGAGTSSGSDSGDSKKSSRDGLPDGFPDDVPLPEFTSANKLGTPSGASRAWNVLLMLKTPTETPMDDYAALLTEAGYSVDDQVGSSRVATGSQWEIAFHTSAQNTLVVTVLGD